MHRPIAIALAALLLPLAACKKNEEPAPATQPTRTAEPAQSAPAVTTTVPSGIDSKAVAVTDPEIVAAADKLLNEKPEPMSAADKANAKDPAKLVGAWTIKHTLMMTNGEGGPAEPLVPTTWTFDNNGKLAIAGGMSMALQYVYTGDKLIISGMGPTQNYDIVKLTDKELHVKMTIAAGSTRIENTTVLER